MRESVVDSNVLFAFRSARDQYHDQATAIFDGMNSGDLPCGVVTNYTLPGALNPILERAGHDHAVDTLAFLTESRSFRIRQLIQKDL